MLFDGEMIALFSADSTPDPRKCLMNTCDRPQGRTSQKEKLINKIPNLGPTQEAYSHATEKGLHIFISLGHQGLTSLEFECVTIKMTPKEETSTFNFVSNTQSMDLD